MPSPRHDSRALERRRVYLGEGLSFELESEDAWLEAEAIDLTHGGIGLAVVHADGDLVLPAVGEAVTLRYAGRGASGLAQQAVVRHVGVLRTARGILPRVGVELVADETDGTIVDRRGPARHACADALPAFAVAECPWFFGETLHFRVVAVGAGGMTLRTARPGAPLLPRAELRFELHLASVALASGHGRVTAVRPDGDGAFEVGVAWIDPPRELLDALSRYLLAGDPALTPAALRDGGLTVGGIERAVAYEYAATDADRDEILALRLRAHQAEGHLDATTADDLRSPFDDHSRHLVCRFGGRIVGYVRVIFVDGDPARSQYVTLGGHEVPQWLWEAGFVEGGAGATDPDFQRAGLYVPLMAHLFRVAVQSGHRYVLGACPDELLAMYRDMGFEVVEERVVEPKPGWRFRSHLLVADTERLLNEPPDSKAQAAMASAIGFAGLPAAA
jgi:ribosomal protein S18 acetylase RimI-like enzyme